MVEGYIGRSPKDLTVKKADITDEKAVFIPLKALDTDIIAVKTSDGEYRLAFNDCMGCYYESGKHGRYKNNADNTALVCDTCHSEVLYEEMGFLTEESMPYPIPETEIISTENEFVISAQYQEVKGQILKDMRSGALHREYQKQTENKK